METRYIDLENFDLHESDDLKIYIDPKLTVKKSSIAIWIEPSSGKIKVDGFSAQIH